MNAINDILAILFPTGIAGISIFLIVRLAIYFAKHPDIVLRWSEIYYKHLGFWETNRQRKIVSSELDYRVTKIANKINRESDGIIPYGLKIKWINDKNQKENASIFRDEVILVLKESADTDKNIVDAFLLFTPKALLPKAREACDSVLLHHLDLYTIKKMLTIGRYTSAYNYFMKTIVDVGINNGSIRRTDIETLQLSDEKGLFSRILLEEFRLLGDELSGTIEEKKFIEDTLDFYTFMKAVVNRRPGENTKLLYLGSRIKVAIVFVAKRATLDSYYGLDSYTHRVELDFKNGAKRVYMMGYKMYQEEFEVDSDGYVVNVVKHASFEYLDEIEKKLQENFNYFVKMSDKYPIRVDKQEKYVKLLTIEQKEFI